MEIHEMYRGYRTIAIISFNDKYVILNSSCKDFDEVYAGFKQAANNLAINDIEIIRRYDRVNLSATERIRTALGMLNTGHAVDLEGLLR